MDKNYSSSKLTSSCFFFCANNCLFRVFIYLTSFKLILPLLPLREGYTVEFFFQSISWNTNLMLISKSAKWRAMRAYTFTCQRALRTHVLTCQRVLGAYMLTCQCTLRTYVLTCQCPSFDATIFSFVAIVDEVVHTAGKF